MKSVLFGFSGVLYTFTLAADLPGNYRKQIASGSWAKLTLFLPDGAGYEKLE